MEMSDRNCHRTIVLWYYEDQLKEKFAKYLGIVKVLNLDPSPYNENGMIQTVYAWLSTGICTSFCVMILSILSVPV